MNAEQLLALYERAADAPGAIPRMRRFVLDLAVRGMLVEQDPLEERASELLEQIATEKARLMKVGGIRGRIEIVSSLPSRTPHELPTSWCWTHFGNIVDFSAGRTPSRNDTTFWNTGDHAWVSIADMEDGETLTATKETVSHRARSDVFKCEPESPGTMMMSFKLTIGKIARLGISAFHNEAIISIRPHLASLDPYLFKVLPDLARGGDTKGSIKGSTLNRESISNLLVPLPPIAEQRRIVAKVEELMALLDRLETARSVREATRGQFAAATLARLTAPEPDPEVARTHARFALDTLPALTTRPDQIRAIRQIILNLALQGSLEKQDPSDEPASELLKRIHREKDKLAAAGIIRREAAFAATQAADRPFDLPHSWEWVPATLPAHGVSDLGKKIQTSEVLDTGTYPVVDQGKVLIRGFCNDESKVLKVTRPIIVFGDHTRETKLIDFDFIVGADGVKLLLPVIISERYYFLALQWLPLESRGYGRHFKLLKSSSIPLPPLGEQHRIVAKVEALLAICDQLESALTETDTSRGRLLEALLHHVLLPTAQVELEAAE